LSAGDENRQEEISGNTLGVYWYVLKKRENCGVREIQRALGFSSSGSAHYHLEKLVDKGFLIKDKYGSYQVNSRVKTGSLSPFVFVHGFIFPRQLLYALATTILNVSFITFLWRFLSPALALAFAPGILACILSWYETVKLWPSLPSFKESV
jgi:uncharacterized membrane protein